MKMIDKRNVDVSKKLVKIRYGDVLKQTRQGYQQPEITLKAFPKDPRVCICKVLSDYLKARNARTNKNCHQLFVKLQRPHNAVGKSTLARWVKDVLKDAGLNMSIFSPHSIRAASTTAAARKKVPLETILKTAGWSNDNVFRKFYKKPVTSYYSIQH